MEILSVVDEGLGHSSYVVGMEDGRVLVVDPARLPVRPRRLVAERGWQLGWSADTHPHAEYISGGPGLADDAAEFLAPARARLEHPHRGVEPGEDVSEEAVTVMCGHGERATTAASPRTGRGHRHVSVLADGPGDRAAATGTDLVAGP